MWLEQRLRPYSLVAEVSLEPVHGLGRSRWRLLDLLALGLELALAAPGRAIDFVGCGAQSGLADGLSCFCRELSSFYNLALIVVHLTYNGPSGLSRSGHFAAFVFGFRDSPEWCLFVLRCCGFGHFRSWCWYWFFNFVCFVIFIYYT